MKILALYWMFATFIQACIHEDDSKLFSVYTRDKSHDWHFVSLNYLLVRSMPSSSLINSIAWQRTKCHVCAGKFLIIFYILTHIPLYTIFCLFLFFFFFSKIHFPTFSVNTQWSLLCVYPTIRAIVCIACYLFVCPQGMQLLFTSIQKP